MNTDKILNFSCDIGKQLMQNGAEIYRVEESLEHILYAYGYEEVEVFAIPSCIIINIQENEKNFTKSVRIKNSVNNLHKLNELNNLCRRICVQKPIIEDAYAYLNEIISEKIYPKMIGYLAYGFVAAFFTLFWGGNIKDAIVSFVCGLAVKATVSKMRSVRANVFFTNLLASILLAIIPLLLVYFQWTINLDTIIIGSIMLLVPGIAITNVVRDVLAGDFLTALTKLAEVLIVGMAIAIGIAIPITGMKMTFGDLPSNIAVQIGEKNIYSGICAFFACLAFCFVFELRKLKYILSASIIGSISWLIFFLTKGIGSEVGRYFIATLVVAILSEVFARVYKAPATLFLIIGIIPLVPGGGIYYTMFYLINNNMNMFLEQGMKTTAYAGAIAVGCSLISSSVRIFFMKKE